MQTHPFFKSCNWTQSRPQWNQYVPKFRPSIYVLTKQGEPPRCSACIVIRHRKMSVLDIVGKSFAVKEDARASDDERGRRGENKIALKHPVSYRWKQSRKRKPRRLRPLRRLTLEKSTSTDDSSAYPSSPLTSDRVISPNARAKLSTNCDTNPSNLFSFLQRSSASKGPIFKENVASRCGPFPQPFRFSSNWKQRVGGCLGKLTEEPIADAAWKEEYKPQVCERQYRSENHQHGPYPLLYSSDVPKTSTQCWGEDGKRSRDSPGKAFGESKLSHLKAEILPSKIDSGVSTSGSYHYDNPSFVGRRVLGGVLRRGFGSSATDSNPHQMEKAFPNSAVLLNRSSYKRIYDNGSSMKSAYVSAALALHFEMGSSKRGEVLALKL